LHGWFFRENKISPTAPLLAARASQDWVMCAMPLRAMSVAERRRQPLNAAIGLWASSWCNMQSDIFRRENGVMKKAYNPT
jgi:hypothetical protein